MSHGRSYAAKADYPGRDRVTFGAKSAQDFLWSDPDWHQGFVAHNRARGDQVAPL